MEVIKSALVVHETFNLAQSLGSLHDRAPDAVPGGPGSAWNHGILQDTPSQRSETLYSCKMLHKLVQDYSRLQPRMLQGENVPGSVVKLKELIRDEGEEVPGLKQSLVEAFGRIY